MPRPAPAPPSAWRAELTETRRLALPVVAVQVGVMLMGVVDTMMVGRLGAVPLAAVALGSLYVYNVTALASGTLLALDPVVAQAARAPDARGVASGVQRGAVLALLLALPTALAMLPAAAVLRALGQPEEVVVPAARFVALSMPGVPAMLGFVVLRQTLQAMHETRAIVATIVLANLVNLILDWMLIFGRLGAPALGTDGTAAATTVARWTMLLALLATAWPKLRPTLVPWRRDAARETGLARLARVGAPIGLQQFLEYSAFGAVGLLVGHLGAVAMAGHQATINLASLTYMVPLGVGAAAAARVGRAVGAGDAAAAGRAAPAARTWGIGFMAVSAAVLLAAPRALARLYTPDPAVIAVTAALIPLAGVFQVFDGLQVVSLGVLRGLGDTRAPMVINIVGFWLIGIPTGVWLGLSRGMGPAGLWIGLVVGLAATGVVLGARVRNRLRGEVRRLVA
ncbi:MATE family efflux transporter [Roseisolibacter sp. H3M3-2]|uniref:MATE family efflux transporter n=1 Tax=Roseisolibacter sp. H3M3-2 TaxID=3031323 RepID=UPI0023D9EC71|nr:MATE family efflux transporter [Roseisolibacter sp. H3M3-2]MDF1503902.1 MATE family efflux transporter [Roseisolibacter sp. H3M3-2]